LEIEFQDLSEELEWANRKPHRKIIICSCPSQIGDDQTIMAQVDAMCQGNANVELTYSSTETTTSHLFENMRISDGAAKQGGAAEQAAPAPVPGSVDILNGRWLKSASTINPQKPICIENGQWWFTDGSGSWEISLNIRKATFETNGWSASVRGLDSNPPALMFRKAGTDKNGQNGEVLCWTRLGL